MSKKVVVPAHIEALATVTVDAALAVHRALGPGLLENTYRECLAIELESRGHRVTREKSLPITYRGHTVANAYRVDLLVDDSLLLELKAVEILVPINRVQTTTYLKLMGLPLGLLINFNVPLLKDGIHRILNLDFQTNVDGN